jgi:hypothetical protein
MLPKSRVAEPFRPARPSCLKIRDEMSSCFAQLSHFLEHTTPAEVPEKIQPTLKAA